MKNILTFLLSIIILSCNETNNADKKIIDSAKQIEIDIKMYKKVWDTFLLDGDTSVVNDKNFTTDVVIVTADGNLIGIDAAKEHYSNYLNGFSSL